MVLDYCQSFKRREPEENKLRIDYGLAAFNTHGPCKSVRMCQRRPTDDVHAAAVILQKVYKSYRTRRSLADCAVVIEELWWKTLKKPETAASRWARACIKAAKVGKGLLKDSKAQKLALRHWLEAIDPRHRYGHNLHLYYDVWFESESTQAFFYWLDIGDGKEVNLQRCPRSVLQSQFIQYLGPKERKAYEVLVKKGKLVYKQTQQLLDTAEGSQWIFVLSTSRKLYVGQKKKGEFQHSSFLSGAATSAAGKLIAKDGVLKAVWSYSGHYHPTEENFKEFICFLQQNNVDLTNVKMSPTDDKKCPSRDAKVKARTAETDVPNLTDSSKPEEDQQQEEDTHHQASTGEGTAPPPLVFGRRSPSSCNWTSGAGPRIGCVSDYPTDLRWMALEQVNLSPRVVPSPSSTGKVPIPSPRPSPGMRLSPRVASMGIPTPRVSLILPQSKTGRDDSASKISRTTTIC